MRPDDAIRLDVLERWARLGARSAEGAVRLRIAWPESSTLRETADAIGAKLARAQLEVYTDEGEPRGLRLDRWTLAGLAGAAADVRAFHAMIDARQMPAPSFGDVALVDLRLDLLREEYDETVAAIGARDLVATADGLVDVIYVAVGALLAFGLPVEAIWQEIHASNMAKAGGPIRADGKRLKPPGWKPPDVAGLIEAARVAATPGARFGATREDVEQ